MDWNHNNWNNPTLVQNHTLIQAFFLSDSSEIIKIVLSVVFTYAPGTSNRQIASAPENCHMDTTS